MTDTPGATQIPEGSRIGIGRTAEVFSWGEGQILKLYRPDFRGAWIETQLLRRAFLGLYLRTYRRLRPVSDTEIDIWLPILATARLNERIPAEEMALLRLAEAESNTGHKMTRIDSKQELDQASPTWPLRSVLQSQPQTPCARQTPNALTA